MTVTDYVISGNDKTWPNSVSQVLFGLEKWFTHQNVCNQAVLPTETIWSLINNDVSCDYIILNYLKKIKCISFSGNTCATRMIDNQN